MVKSCVKINDCENFVLDAFFHIFMLCLVLGVFFFTVVSKLEKKSLTDEIKRAVDRAFKPVKVTSNAQMVDILTTIDSVYPAENEADKVYNTGLKNQCWIILGMLFLCLLCVWLTMKWSALKCPNLPAIILQNILLFGSIGVVQYLFFTHVASKFIPVMPSFMIEVINEKIDEYNS